MACPGRYLAVLMLLTGCQAHNGDSQATAQPPSDQALAAIPLGAPPGGGPPAQIRNPFEGDAAAVEQGKALFGTMNCVYCHGAQGSGLMGPPLNGHGWRYGGTPAQIYNSIRDGRPQGMPAWGTHLPPDQIWRLVAYIESLGGALPPATPAMAKLGATQPSTTGPQAAGQNPADSAEAGRQAGNHSDAGQ